MGKLDLSSITVEQACNVWNDSTRRTKRIGNGWNRVRQNVPGVHYEKSMGRNHVRHLVQCTIFLSPSFPPMTCLKCKTHFCYRCGNKISATNLYQHFSTSGTSRYSKLFDFVPSGEGGWQPIEAFEFI
ncbi:hypothetical protein F5141DRAFT_1079930 [Pisolithus sp. B1]|nr:hypothetical protein F5141DRAFT_1079930 [Pisolithus sp. B1]